MKVLVNNLKLTYPIPTGNSFLANKSLLEKILKIFKKKKINDNLTFNEDKKIHNLTALKNINFELKSGDRLGLIGLNGSGKSTLIKCLSKILPVDKGSKIEIEGNFLPIISPINMCETEDTVLNNLITVGLLMGFKKDLIIENADKILDFAEVKNYHNFPFQSLSTGMRFRLISSICFVLKRDIYFIDEFLTTSDEKFQEKSFKMINKFSHENIIVLCSHSQRTIKNFCNKLLVLNQGEQVYFGDVTEGINEYKKIIDSD